MLQAQLLGTLTWYVTHPHIKLARLSALRLALKMLDINTGTLVPQHGYVLLTFLVSVFTVHMFMSLKVGKARKTYGVKYPALYADSSNPNANNFNCVQRGHQNTLEGYPLFLGLLFAAGIQYPTAASLAGLVYIAGRVAYFLGYSSGNPGSRQKGAFFHFGELAFLALISMSAYNLLTSKNLKVAS